MSNGKQETISDIVREMRIGDLCASDTAARSMYINDFLASYADRIEAAWNREREAGAEAAHICGEIGEMIVREAACKQLVTNCNRFGNVAAMREALARNKRNCDRFKTVEQANETYHEECCYWFGGYDGVGGTYIRKNGAPSFERWLFKKAKEVRSENS